MASFIKLTKGRDTKPVLANIDQVNFIHPDPDGTMIYFGSGSYIVVKEPIDVVAAMLAKKR